MANLRDVRREAVLQAELLLADLDIGPADRIRIFDLIEDQRIWLTFEPLDKLYGWYQRIGDTVGVAINASHPAPLQRYTAAHELGHHLLGHAQCLDDERTVIDGGQGTDPKEVGAYTFASDLLMPLAAVEHHLIRLGLDPARPRVVPADVYRLSVELGVSYMATAVQLASLNKITWDAVPALRRARPLALKQQLVGRTPDYSRAAVWLLNEADDGRHLMVDVGDELHVRLKEIRSSGYRWVPAAPTLEAFSVLDDALVPADDTERRYGAARARRLVLKAVNPGARSIVVDLRHAWEPKAEPAQRFAITVDIEEPRVSSVGRGISVNQQPQLMAA
jgi:Zn-dependent peptidase ImmA (M78 family)/predicted secreted protein